MIANYRFKNHYKFSKNKQEMHKNPHPCLGILTDENQRTKENLKSNQKQRKSETKDFFKSI